jgi:hypothetical protein
MTLWREQMFGWNVQPGTSVWRTSAVRAGGGWDESIPRCEDLEFNLRLCRERVALVPAIVMQYRMHPGQAQGEVRAYDLELDRQIRDKFVAGLPSRDRETAERIRAALAIFQRALAAYEGGDFRAAAGGLSTMFRTAPYLARSPVLAPWLLGLLAKSLASIGVPRAVRQPVANLRQARHRRRLSDAAPR